MTPGHGGGPGVGACGPMAGRMVRMARNTRELTLSGLGVACVLLKLFLW